MTLTVCLVTRDAERNIERAMRSVAPLGCDTLVVDTGSQDSTVAVARSLGASVCTIPWRDDFAEAQNWALEQARSDWVLWLNPDEELVESNRDLFARFLARVEALAYVMRVQEIAQLNQTNRCVETWQPRLIRRQSNLRYVGRMHPLFVPPLEEVARQECKNMYRTDVMIRHHAYTSVLTVGKLRWATRLLELELHDRPGQLHYLIEYGRNLLRLNDPQGHTILAEASRLVTGHLNAQVAPSSTVSSLLEYLLAVSSDQSRSMLSPMQAVDLVQRWFPNSPPLIWALAERAFKAESFLEAAGLLERLIEMGRSGTYDHFAAFNPALIGELAQLNLGCCYLRLHEPSQAELCFAPLLGHPSYGEQARRGYAQAQSMRLRTQSR